MKNEIAESGRKLLELIGITDLTGVFNPLIEDNRDGEVYVKFMSDEGLRDNELGIALQVWLDENEVDYQAHRLRSLTLRHDQFVEKAGFDILNDEDEDEEDEEEADEEDEE